MLPMVNKILLLFTDSLPCWDEDTVALSGETPDSLDVLAGSGCLERLGGGYVLTQAGIREREEASRENFVPVPRITRIISDPAEANSALEINRMTQLLDRAFLTDWGIKEISIREEFPVVPCLDDDEYFRLEHGKAVATWQTLPMVQDFMSCFPDNGYSARKLPVPGPEALYAWAKSRNAQRGTLTMDFVLRHRHDFEHYRQLKVPEGDVFRFINAGVIFAHKVMEKPEELLPFIGKVHLFFAGQRRVYIPGWFDMDSEEQEPWKLLTLVTDTESQLQDLTCTLRTWGNALIEPARPMFIIGTSIERLRAQEVQARMFYDWFAEHTVKILRPDVQD